MTMMPNPSIQNIIRSGVPLTYKRAPLWDFDTGEFLIQPDGQLIEATDSRTLGQLAHALLLIERGVYVILGPDVGSDLWRLIGYSREFVRSRINRTVTEAMIDPRIAVVKIDEPEVTGSSIFVNGVFIDQVANSRRVIQLTAGAR